MKYKKVDCSVLSNKRCVEPGCHKRLKQNLVNRQPDADHCYAHYPKSKKNRMGANPKSRRQNTESRSKNVGVM